MSGFASKLKACVIAPHAFFLSIRKDELEILSKLSPLENYQLDELGDLMIVDNRPVTVSINPPTKMILPESNSFYSAVKDCNATVSQDTLNAYEDVFGLDPTLKDKAKLLCLFEDDIYQGCVWTFENVNFFGIYGIRTSLANTLTGKKGMASQFLKMIMESTSKTIVVPWPLEGMIPLLRKSGFVEHNTQESTPERKFLAPYTTTSNYWTLERQSPNGSSLSARTILLNELRKIKVNK
jgi:hypothetical protein